MSPAQRRAVVWLAALLSAALTLKLGFWQLGRAQEKREAHERTVAQRAQPAWHGKDWPCDPAFDAASLPLDKPVQLRGRWLESKTVFLDNRPMDGISGFVVVTPLQLGVDLATDAVADNAAGRPACKASVILVERGWVPRDMRDRQRLPALPPSPGDIQVSGRVTAGISRTYQLGSEAPAQATSNGPLLRQNADVAFWRQWLGQAPLAGAVLQTQADAPAGMTDNAQAKPDALRRHWPEPGSGQDKHLAYAAQWFALAALIVGLTLWFQIIRPHRRASSHVPS